MKENNGGFEYNANKLHQIVVRNPATYYKNRPATISMNTRTGIISVTKKAMDILKMPGTKSLKLIFLSDGFKMFVDSMVQAEETNFLTVPKTGTACSMDVVSEFQKLYKINDGDRGVFTMGEEVEKNRYLLVLDKTEPITTRKTSKDKDQVEV